MRWAKPKIKLVDRRRRAATFRARKLRCEACKRENALGRPQSPDGARVCRFCSNRAFETPRP